MKRIVRELWRSDGGAVAPTVGLALFGLIAVSGIAFDYARLAAMDSELQNAADQAALAAASQLDGTSGARERAIAAAQALLRNTTVFASDDSGVEGDSRRVTIAEVEFFESYNEVADTYGTAVSNDVSAVDTATDAKAKVVEVTVGTRVANYALTPVVDVLSSPQISAQALASLSSAICNVPPLMFCKPPGSGEFPTEADIGKGVLLEPGPQVGAWYPGEYGYLDFGTGSKTVSELLGENNEFSGCTDETDGIQTEPGQKTSVTDSLNTRFDVYQNSVDPCDPSTGDYCPAENVRKDFVRTETWEKPGTSGSTPAAPSCGDAGATVSNFTVSPAATGLPRDNCHMATGGCTGEKFGDGIWNRAAYFAANHTSADLAAAAAWAGKDETAATGPTALTRWDVYLWELDDPATRMLPRQVSASTPTYSNKKGGTWTFTKVCAYPSPVIGTGVPASSDQKDRRRMTVASVDCTGFSGKETIKIERWVDVFLVEPSEARTYSSGVTSHDAQIYGEILGVAQRAGGQSAFQYYMRQRPRLLR